MCACYLSFGVLAVFPNTLSREQELYLFISLKTMPFNIILVASEYQEIYPYGVVNIDNAKISTTMMNELPIFKQAHMGSCKTRTQVLELGPRD